MRRIEKLPPGGKPRPGGWLHVFPESSIVVWLMWAGSDILVADAAWEHFSNVGQLQVLAWPPKWSSS